VAPVRRVASLLAKVAMARCVSWHVLSRPVTRSQHRFR